MMRRVPVVTPERACGRFPVEREASSWKVNVALVLKRQIE
jgi:hypothetical protein